MLIDIIASELNTQVKEEFYSAHLYLSMSSYVNHIGLPGMSHWFFLQYKEETEHALKCIKYIQDRGSKYISQGIDMPPDQWASPLGVFEESLKHERALTALIHRLIDLSMSEKDHCTTNMLQWFISEQVEEESTCQMIIDKIKLLQNSNQGLYLLDQELGHRPSSV